MPSLPQPLISFPEAATLFASNVPLDKGNKGSGTRLLGYQSRTQTLLVLWAKPTKIEEDSG